jgi:hypothetical protein
MVLPFIINGARAVIPGVYDKFRVEDSLPAVAPAGRNVVVLGESSEGIPGKDLDLQLNYFTDYQSVQDFYKSGPIVDAARQLFTNQPSPAFGGSIQRLYVYKTNSTTRASKEIASPAGYGSIVAARYGEAGNQIKSQIKTATSESKPEVTFNHLPSPAATSFKVSVDGVLSAALNLAANGTPAQLVAALNGVTGLLATGGAAKTSISGGTMDIALSAANGSLTLTKSGGAGVWGTIAAGDTLTIAAGSALAGASDENAGAYIVTSATTTVLVARRLVAHSAVAPVNAQAFDISPVVGATGGDIVAWSPVTVEVTATTVNGSAATLEIAEAAGGVAGAASLHQEGALADILSQSAATSGSVSATVVAASTLKISISSASWTRIPKVGDVVRIEESSSLKGATLKNVGSHVVTQSSAQQITLVSANGLAVEAVTSTQIGGNTAVVKLQPGFVSTTVSSRRIDSSAERQVQILASRSTDGASFPADKVGGAVGLELSWNDGVATAAKVSIDQNNKMTIDLTGGTDITVNLKKYSTLQELADFLNTIPGCSARIPDGRLKSVSPKDLDKVTEVSIMSVHSAPAYNGRIKTDYASFKALLDNNFGLLALAEGTMLLKCGLPDEEASASFLSGAEVGSSNDAEFQAGLDAALKVSARVICPLVSRDARFDIEDGLTDENSSYTIDSVNAAVKAHVATASSTLNRRERFGAISVHCSFEDAIQKATEQSYERTQMTFQMVRATDASGSLTWFAPWMGAVALTAGRVQASASTPMLRKPFNLNAVKHIGEKSLLDDTLTLDFDPEDSGLLTRAIEAGLLVFRAVPGFGVRLESPDATTRSRQNDPQGWVWERANVLFAADEVRDTLRTVLDNYIGSSTLDVGVSTVNKAVSDTLNSFRNQGVIISFSVDKIVKEGNGYRVSLSIFFPEALEFIGLDVLARRDVG